MSLLNYKQFCFHKCLLDNHRDTNNKTLELKDGKFLRFRTQQLTQDINVLINDAQSVINLINEISVIISDAQDVTAGVSNFINILYELITGVSSTVTVATNVANFLAFFPYIGE